MHIKDDEDVLAENFTDLAISAFEQVLQDVHCYYYHTGTFEDRNSGKYAITWVRKMKGSFRILAMAMQETTLEELHQGLLAYINKVKLYARRGIQSPYKTSQIRRISNMYLV